MPVKPFCTLKANLVSSYSCPFCAIVYHLLPVSSSLPEMTASASNFTFLSMPSLLPGMYFLNTAAKPQSSFKTHSSSNVKCKQWSENSSPDGLWGLQMSSSLSLSLHPHSSSHLKLGWWVYYHPSAIPIFGRRRSAGVMETITILNPQNSHEAALGSWEKFPSASSLPLQVSSPHWDQNLPPLSAKGKLRNWKCKAHLGCATKKCYQREDSFLLRRCNADRNSKEYHYLWPQGDKWKLFSVLINTCEHKLSDLYS